MIDIRDISDRIKLSVSIGSSSLHRFELMKEDYVVPYIGTWIETVDNRYACPSESVVPYIGTCIGQKLIHVS